MNEDNESYQQEIEHRILGLSAFLRDKIISLGATERKNPDWWLALIEELEERVYDLSKLMAREAYLEDPEVLIKDTEGSKWKSSGKT